MKRSRLIVPLISNGAGAIHAKSRAMPLRKLTHRSGGGRSARASVWAHVTLRPVVIVVVGTAIAMAVRWFIHVAKQAEGRSREPRPRSITDHRR